MTNVPEKTFWENRLTGAIIYCLSKTFIMSSACPEGRYLALTVSRKSTLGNKVFCGLGFPSSQDFLDEYKLIHPPPNAYDYK